MESDLFLIYTGKNCGKAGFLLLVQRIDPLTGKVISTSEKQIDNSLLATTAEDVAEGDSDNDGESRAERKERERLDKIKDEGEGFSSYMKFRQIFYTEDGGLVVLAEKNHHYFYTTTSYTTGTGNMPGQSSSTTYSVYECGDLLMCKVEGDGNISWLRVLPKAQREVSQSGHSYGGGFSISGGFFDASNRPFYAGFGAIQSANTINIIFNDNPKNAVVTQPGQKVKITKRFNKSDCFVLSVNEATGKFSRKPFFSNTTTSPTAMPRLGTVIGDGMYIIGKEDRFLGKSKIAVARITL